MREMRDLADGFGADRVAMLGSKTVEEVSPFGMCIVKWGFPAN